MNWNKNYIETLKHVCNTVIVEYDRIIVYVTGWDYESPDYIHNNQELKKYTKKLIDEIYSLF